MFLVIWYHSVLLNNFKGQLGMTVKTHRAKQFLTCCLWSQKTQFHSYFPPGPAHMRETCCNLFGEKGKGQRVTLVALCELGQGLNIASSYFFRSKSNRGWPSGRGLLPKNTATKFLNNIRISLSSWSQVQRWKKSKGIYCLGKNAENLTVANDETVFLETSVAARMEKDLVARPAHPGRDVAFRKPVFADRGGPCPRGHFCHVAWAHPYRPFTLWLRNRLQLLSIFNCLLLDFQRIALVFKNRKYTEKYKGYNSRSLYIYNPQLR